MVNISDLPESYRDIAEIIGFEAAMKLVEHCGGQNLYIPKKDSCELLARRRYIYAQWQEGVDCLSLAKRFNYTDSHVRQIVREERAKEFQERTRQEEFNF